MEKITYPPLLKVLKDNSIVYNQLYYEYEISNPSIAKDKIVNWMVNVIEPIIQNMCRVTGTTDNIHQVFSTLYRYSLKLLGNGLAITYASQYKLAWKIISNLPKVLTLHPEAIVSTIHSALNTIRKYRQENCMKWLELVYDTSEQLNTLNDLIVTGRIYAWICGLAHLRDRVAEQFGTLSESLQRAIVDVSGLQKPIREYFVSPWGQERPCFKGVAGGFIGMGGVFFGIPKLTIIDNMIIVADKKKCYGFFADQFGKVLVPIPSLEPEKILSQIKKEKSIEKRIKKLIPIGHLPLISSICNTKDTVVYTLANSHFMYSFNTNFDAE